MLGLFGGFRAAVNLTRAAHELTLGRTASIRVPNWIARMPIWNDWERANDYSIIALPSASRSAVLLYSYEATKLNPATTE